MQKEVNNSFEVLRSIINETYFRSKHSTCQWWHLSIFILLIEIELKIISENYTKKMKLYGDKSWFIIQIIRHLKLHAFNVYFLRFSLYLHNLQTSQRSNINCILGKKWILCQRLLYEIVYSGIPQGFFPLIFIYSLSLYYNDYID